MTLGCPIMRPRWPPAHEVLTNRPMADGTDGATPRYDENGDLEGCFECPAGMIKKDDEELCMCMVSPNYPLARGGT